MSNNLPGDLPPHHPKNDSTPTERNYERPVAWLLGRDLMRSLKGTLLYTAFGRKLDPRDWMLASVFPDLEKKAALKFWWEKPKLGVRTPDNAPADPPQDEKFWEKKWAGKEEFWFDYIADTGDGMRAVYSLAYLCLGDLWTKELYQKLPPDAADRKVKHHTGNEPQKKDFKTLLPRGEFLFIGGDTAYHLSDYMTLASRVQQPFRWAFEDRVKFNPDFEREPRRPLFGIPGNHDYYDQLDGFRRQFRKKTRKEPDGLANRKPAEVPQLVVEGFYRTQDSSYVALHLPFDWWIWGLDTEMGQVDLRQQKFFLDLHKQQAPQESDSTPDPPDKLIVATSSPTTYFGKLASVDDGKAATALGQIGLSQPFWPKVHKEDAETYSFDVVNKGKKNEKINLASAGDAKVKPGQCRLDISGDVHHYARYWGPKNDQGGEPVRAHGKADAPDAGSYASVVSGLGGAFHHPSTTYADQIKEQALYPAENISRQAIAGKIFNPLNIIRGGYVWLIGFILAFTICFAATVPRSSRQFIRNLPLLNLLGVTKPEEIEPTVIWNASLSDLSDREQAVNKALSRPSPAPAPNATPSIKLVYLNQLRIKEWPMDFLTGVMFLLGSLGLIIFGFASSKLIFGAEEKEGAGAEEEEKASVIKNVGGEDVITAAPHDKEIKANPFWKLIGFVGGISLTTGLGFWLVAPYRLHLTPFGNSLIVLFSIICAIAGIALSIRYSEFLFKKCHDDYIGRYDWTWPWVLTILSLAVVIAGLWSFGKNNLPALLVFDIFFIVVVVGLAVAMIGAAATLGGELQTKPIKALMAITIGVVHAVLQIATPFLLIQKGEWLTWAVALVLLVISSLLGWMMLRSKNRLVFRWGLTAVGLLYGAAMLALPYLGSSGFELYHFARWEGQGGWAGFWVAFAAGLVGALMCCVWFAWYLAVCFVFNGHNNEVGGAGQIEDYKQFIRFRLTNDSLTGYVIAVDKVNMIGAAKEDGQGKKDGSYLRPHLIDVFHLKVKG